MEVFWSCISISLEFIKTGQKIDFSKSKIYHYHSEFKDEFYKKDWGISHSCFINEPFGYGIFEAVDYGKLPILYENWCKDFKYPYRATFKKDFDDIIDIRIESTGSCFLIIKSLVMGNDE